MTSLLARLSALRGARANLAAAVLGVLSAAALPPVHALPVLLIAVPGLLALLDGAAGPRRAAILGFWFGFGHHVPGLYWITDAILIEAARFWWLVPLAVPALASVLALFIAAACAVARLARRGWRRALVLAGAWVLADLVRQFVLTGFPWNPWGSVWAIPGLLGDLFLQPAAWVGVPGLTLATLLIAATPALGRWAMVTGAVALAAWAGFGLWRLSRPGPVPPDLVAVVAQGVVPQDHKWDRDFALAAFRRYLALTRDGVARAGGHPAVVVWPETASPFLLESDTSAREAVADALGGATGLIGSVRFDAHERPRNSLLAVTGSGSIAAIYDKWHLVPFGEYQPDWFPLPIQIVPGRGFARGDGPMTLHVAGLPAAGALICYEAIFPAQVIDARDRPAWLVNVTNDAWFGDSTGPRQHLAAARMRAVEEGLPLVRAANTGISAVYDPYGRELGRIGINVASVLVVPVPGPLPPPPFARAGLWIPGLLALAVVAIGLVAGRGPVGLARKSKKENAQES